ncbi:hypothetical protein Tco_0173286 [Tanacetum coccineum]
MNLVTQWISPHGGESPKLDEDKDGKLRSITLCGLIGTLLYLQPMPYHVSCQDTRRSTSAQYTTVGGDRLIHAYRHQSFTSSRHVENCVIDFTFLSIRSIQLEAFFNKALGEKELNSYQQARNAEFTGDFDNNWQMK